MMGGDVLIRANHIFIQSYSKPGMAYNEICHQERFLTFYSKLYFKNTEPVERVFYRVGCEKPFKDKIIEFPVDKEEFIIYDGEKKILPFWVFNESYKFKLKPFAKPVIVCPMSPWREDKEYSIVSPQYSKTLNVMECGLLNFSSGEPTEIFIRLEKSMPLNFFLYQPGLTNQNN